MSDDSRFKSSPFKGKQIRFEHVPTDGIDNFLSIADEFMRRIFELEPHQYMITDESLPSDFRGVIGNTREDIFDKIRSEYGPEVADLGNVYFVAIFRKIRDVRAENARMRIIQ